jgi:CheY-like chemotaxis protein
MAPKEAVRLYQFEKPDTELKLGVINAAIESLLIPDVCLQVIANKSLCCNALKILVDLGGIMYAYYPCHPTIPVFVSTPQKAAQILVVADNPQLSSQICAGLEAKYRVTAATTSHEALLKFEQEEIDLVLLDVMTNTIDGFGICQMLRQYSKVPIIIMTAQDNTEQIIQGLDLGADDSIAEPISTCELTARIQALLRRMQLVNGYVNVQRSYQLESLN